MSILADGYSTIIGATSGGGGGGRQQPLTLPLDMTLVDDSSSSATALPAGAFHSFGSNPALAANLFMSTVEKDGTDHTAEFPGNEQPLWALVVGATSGAAALFNPASTNFDLDEGAKVLHLKGSVTWNSTAFTDGEDVTVTLSDTALALP